MQAISLQIPALSPPPPADFSESGIALRIFDDIPKGFGVVAITGDYAGSHLLQHGEVAVYDERWRDDIGRDGFILTPGLYALEHQRPIAGSRHPDGRRLVTREVVEVLHWPYPTDWAYRELRSRMHRGARLRGRIEGPLYEWGILEMLLGPVVGIYRPQFGRAS